MKGWRAELLEVPSETMCDIRGIFVFLFFFSVWAMFHGFPHHLHAYSRILIYFMHDSLLVYLSFDISYLGSRSFYFCLRILGIWIC